MELEREREREKDRNRESVARVQRASFHLEREKERGKKGEKGGEREREVAGVGAPPFFRTRQPHVWQRVCACTRTCASMRTCGAGV